MWNFIVKALKEALKEKVTEMTKEEVKEWLDKIGVKVEEVTDELIAKVKAQKALLDAETRRKTRLFWGPVGLLIGAVVGYVCAAFFCGVFLFFELRVPTPTSTPLRISLGGFFFVRVCLKSRQRLKACGRLHAIQRFE